jgi:glycosyltransferase involved in cell wall biosynthesis
VHVAFLAVDIDLSGATGDVSHVKDLSLALTKAGSRVDLFVASAGVWDPPADLSLHEVPGHGTLLSAIRIWRTLRHQAPDVIYERRFSPKLSALIACIFQRPFFVEINGLVELEMAMQGRAPQESRPGRLLRHGFRKLLYKRAYSIITVSDGIREALCAQYELPAERIQVVPNGVDVELFHPIPTSEARQRLGLNQDRDFAIFVGNIVSWQGLDTVVEAIDITRRDVPLIQLLLVGDGQDRGKIENLVRQRGLSEAIRFVGRVHREDVPLWIAAADVAISPRKTGTQSVASPLKLREYLACGRPVITSIFGGKEPRPEDHRVGFSVESGDAAALADALVRSLHSGEERQAMGRRARDLAIRELTWDRVAQHLIAMFNSAVTGG